MRCAYSTFPLYANDESLNIEQRLLSTTSVYKFFSTWTMFDASISCVYWESFAIQKYIRVISYISSLYSELSARSIRFKSIMVLAVQIIRLTSAVAAAILAFGTESVCAKPVSSEDADHSGGNLIASRDLGLTGVGGVLPRAFYQAVKIRDVEADLLSERRRHHKKGRKHHHHDHYGHHHHHHEEDRHHHHHHHHGDGYGYGNGHPGHGTETNSVEKPTATGTAPPHPAHTGTETDTGGESTATGASTGKPEPTAPATESESGGRYAELLLFLR